MREREIILYPDGQPDGPILRGTTWVPEKTFVEKVGNFSIWVSEPEAPGIQLALRHHEGSGDYLQVDLQRNEAVGVRWAGESSLEEFLESMETYLTEQDADKKRAARLISHLKRDDLIVRLFADFEEPEFYDAARPLVIDDFNDTEIVSRIGLDNLSMIRIDSPSTDFFYHDQGQVLGWLSSKDNFDRGEEGRRLTEFISGTQPALPEETLSRAFQFARENHSRL